ncbi:MAG: acetylglutamate kinase [Enterobacterales bacterium]|jgi:acetylglutamate kinase
MTSTEKKPLAVIKVGGDVLLDEQERNGLAKNVDDLYQLGWNIIILHGGGPQVNELQRHHGLTPLKISGRRVTSERDLQVVKQAIAGEVNVNLVSLLAASGLPAFGCHGASGGLIKATKRPPVRVSGHNEELIDFGEVGDVTEINVKLLQQLLAIDSIPVIATLGIDDLGNIYNINADTTVVRIAIAMNADLLLLITQIGGIYRDINEPNSLITDITPDQAQLLIQQKIIKDGMIPKVEEAITCLREGVKSIAITAASNKGVFKELGAVQNHHADIKATRIYM